MNLRNPGFRPSGVFSYTRSLGDNDWKRISSHSRFKERKLINMSVSVCPMDIINAPIEKVWTLLSEPANYALWWEPQTRSIVPEGRAQSGQKIHAKASGLDVNVIVNSCDESKHQIHLTTMLPFGITVHSHITFTPLENGTCQVSFG